MISAAQDKENTTSLLFKIVSFLDEHSSIIFGSHSIFA